MIQETKGRQYGGHARPCRKKRGERILLVGHEEVPHGFRLRSGDCGDTADGATGRNWEE